MKKTTPKIRPFKPCGPVGYFCHGDYCLDVACFECLQPWTAAPERLRAFKYCEVHARAWCKRQGVPWPGKGKKAHA